MWQPFLEPFKAFHHIWNRIKLPDHNPWAPHHLAPVSPSGVCILLLMIQIPSNLTISAFTIYSASNSHPPFSIWFYLKCPTIREVAFCNPVTATLPSHNLTVILSIDLLVYCLSPLLHYKPWEALSAQATIVYLYNSVTAIICAH